jgi:predicted AlkP superfamily pyrophosphatase or phosphodiesterase
VNRNILFFLLLLIGSTAATSAPQQPRGTTSNHVVIISLDGFPGWALDDPYLPVPTLRRLAAQGVVAKGMTAVNPTVTWPNHTSMVTGVTPAKHGVLFNGILKLETGAPPQIEPWRDKTEMVKVPTLYDAAHQKGMTTAQVDWVAILNAATVTWEFAERPSPNAQVPRELVKAGILSAEDLQSFQTRNIVWRDHIWTMAAAHILRQHRPNLLMFHLLNLDSTHHRYGPRTPAAMSTMALLDGQVATIVETLEQTGLAPRTSLFIVSDHGFKLVKRQIRPNAAFAKAGLLDVQQNKVAGAQAYSVPEGGTALVYVTVPDPSGALLKRAKEALVGIEGIASIGEQAEFSRYGLPQPDQNPQMGSLFLIAKDGYSFTADLNEPFVVDAPLGSLGAHGYLASDPDLRSLFIASGRGIRRGLTLDSVDVIDLAPTMARLLGFEMSGVDGKVLGAILTPELQRR